MSVDLDWSKLDASFASSLIDLLNRQLQTTPRPSFIGPIEITSFDFGSQPPDIELIDLRDIYRDFLEDDDEDDGDEHGNGNAVAVERDAPRSAAGQGHHRHQQYGDDEDEDGEFEWVSRKTAGRSVAEEPPTMYYHHLPPHVRYARGPASDVFALARPPSLRPSSSSSSVVGGSAPPPPVLGTGTRTGSVWSAAVGAGAGLSSSLGALPVGQRRAISPLSMSVSMSASAAPSWRSFPGAGTRQTRSSHLGSTRPTAAPSSSPSPSPSPSPPPSPSPFSPQHPDLAGITADPPSPSPPPLVPPRGPTTTTARGVASTGTTQDDEVAPAPADADDAQPNLQLHLLVSWHSDLRLTLTTSLRINYPSPLFMSLPIKLSVTGLVFTGELAVAYEGGRRVHLCVLDDLDPYGPSARRFAGSHSRGNSTPSDPEGDGDAPAAKPLPVGHRLLPEIFIESELGQADKHVLKNVTRVEKFIQDVIRKTIEEELVFPNFHTLVLR